MADLNLSMVEGDTGPSKTFVVTRDGVAVPKAGVSGVKLILMDTSSYAITNTGHQSCSILGTTDLEVQYDFQANDVGTPNIHLGDLQITFSNGRVETYPDYVYIHVRPKAGTVS